MSMTVAESYVGDFNQETVYKLQLSLSFSFSSNITMLTLRFQKPNVVNLHNDKNAVNPS